MRKRCAERFDKGGAVDGFGSPHSLVDSAVRNRTRRRDDPQGAVGHDQFTRAIRSGTSVSFSLMSRWQQTVESTRNHAHAGISVLLIFPSVKFFRHRSFYVSPMKSFANSLVLLWQQLGLNHAFLLGRDWGRRPDPVMLWSKRRLQLLYAA